MWYQSWPNWWQTQVTKIIKWGETLLWDLFNLPLYGCSCHQLYSMKVFKPVFAFLKIWKINKSRFSLIIRGQHSFNVYVSMNKSLPTSSYNKIEIHVFWKQRFLFGKFSRVMVMFIVPLAKFTLQVCPKHKDKHCLSSLNMVVT